MVLWEQVEAAELDEMWSFVGNKGCQRWLWLAIDRKTHAVLAYVFGQRKDKVFRELKALLEPFGIKMFHTDDWGSYQRNIAPDRHTVCLNWVGSLNYVYIIGQRPQAPAPPYALIPKRYAVPSPNFKQKLISADAADLSFFTAMRGKARGCGCLVR